MAARRKAHHTDALRVYFQFTGFCAYCANCALYIPKHGWMVVARPQAILKHKRRHADAVEPEGHIMPFVARKAAISASRANDNGRAVGFVGSRGIMLNARNVYRLSPLSSRSACCP